LQGFILAVSFCWLYHFVTRRVSSLHRPYMQIHDVNCDISNSRFAIVHSDRRHLWFFTWAVYFRTARNAMDVRSITSADPAAIAFESYSRIQSCLHMQIHMIVWLRKVSCCVTSYQHRLMIPDHKMKRVLCCLNKSHLFLSLSISIYYFYSPSLFFELLSYYIRLLFMHYLFFFIIIYIVHT